MTCHTLKPVTHVIFDNDGLLLNTETLYEEAISTILSRYGKGKYTWELKLKQMGRAQEVAYQIIIDEYKLPMSVQQMIKETDALLLDRFPNSQLMPGADRLIRHLHTHNVPIGLCTASRKKYFALKTSKHKELYQLFHHVVCIPEEVEIKTGKPHPDCYLVCASRFADPVPKPSSVLVFEDSANGVEAALMAGMQVVMVPDRRMAPENRLAATQCIDSLLDFKPEAFGLPPFQ
uniref:pseudouridine 5'-phosphatase n=1 Tax=Trichuris muris TaxID=70415 RepID=A0A5S6QEC9_TRIMR